VKNPLFYIVFLLTSHYALAQYITHEDAFENLSDEPCKCITITPDDNYKSGSFWNETPLDLSESFEIIVKPTFGCNTESSDGGDGIAFLLQTNGTGQLPTGDGGNLGYNGISPSLVVQFDTYRDNPIIYPENNDPGGGFFPFYDHVGLMKNGSCNHETADDLSTEPFSPTFTDVEDCTLYSDHQITFLWDVTTQKFQVIYCNDLEGCFTVADQTIDISNDIFSGNTLVNWGFTGSTAGAKNEQGICVQYFDKQPTLQDTVVCFEENLVIDLSCMNNFSFEWKDLAGNIISTSSVFDIVPIANNDYELSITNNYTARTFTEFFSVTVLHPVLEEVVAEHIDNDCFGYSDGQLALNYIDAIGEVNYSLDALINQTDSTFSNLFAGNYELVAQDEFGCRDTLEITITEEPEIIINIDNVVGVVCNTTNTGSIEVTPTGGVGGYTVSWVDDGGTNYNDEDLFALNDGFYDYTVTDANNCVSTGQVFVDQINSIDMDTLSLVHVDCFEGSTGEISINPTGGLAPFTFDWSGPNGFVSNQSNISNLNSGEYTLTLTDFENCYRIYPFTLDEGDEVLIDVLSTTDANCSYSADGVVEIAHSGGNNTSVGIILDEILNLVSNSDVTSTLVAGNYFAYAEDNLGCSSVSIHFSIGAPSEIIISPLDVDDVECFGDDDGKVQITLVGGTLPYNGFSWVGPNGYSNSAQNIYSLFAGNYTVTATDDNGCVKTESFLVNESSDISIGTAAVEYVKCKGDNSGAITPLITGGTPPYGNYSWSGQGGFTATTLAINNLYVGEYTLTMEDSFDCEKEYTFNIYEPDSLLQLTVTSTPSCLIERTGQASLNIIGGEQPYNIDWLGLNPTALSAGTNYVQVTDNANCVIVDTFYVDLLPQPTADFEVDSVIKLNTPTRLLNTSSNEISWNWDFGNQSYSVEESPSVIYDIEGNYIVSLQVLNNEGCSDTISKAVSVINSLVLYIPNTFTPNGDFKNDKFNVSALNYTDFEMNIHNYYGTKMFSTTDPLIGWDGTYKGRSVQEGTYVVSIFAIDVFGRVYKRNKNIILLK
jgi:gliding motility-associated-like protein